MKEEANSIRRGRSYVEAREHMYSSFSRVPNQGIALKWRTLLSLHLQPQCVVKMCSKAGADHRAGKEGNGDASHKTRKTALRAYVPATWVLIWFRKPSLQIGASNGAHR